MATYFERELNWLVPKDEKHFETLTAHLIGTNKLFRNFAEREAKNFCGALRKMVSDESRGKPEMKKTRICRKYHLAARTANMVKKVAGAMVSSAKECLALNRGDIEDDIKRAEKEVKKMESLLEGKLWVWKVRRNLGDKKAASRQETIRKLENKIAGKRRFIERRTAKLARMPKSPSVFVFGRKLYKAQPKGNAGRAKWRKEFRKARDCMFGAPGSSDEIGGNSTYRLVYNRDITKCTKYLGAISTSTEVEFSVMRLGQVAARFSLKERVGRELQAILDANNKAFEFVEVESKTVKDAEGKPKTVSRKVRAGRTPLKVTFIRSGNGWRISISYPMQAAPVIREVKGAIGVDTNHGHFDSYEVAQDGFIFGQYHHNFYDVGLSRGEKKRAISAHIRRLVFRARELGYAIVLEKLDFEYAKSTLKTKLGATLHTMPYRSLAGKFQRECTRLGVPIRFVDPAYTSLWGTILATLNPRLSRDVAAAGVIGLIGLEGGAQYFLSLVDEVESSGEPGSFRLRINEKNKCGRHVEVVGVNLRQMDSKVPANTGNQFPQRYGGVVVKNLAKAASPIRRAGRIICRASSETGRPTPTGNHSDGQVMLAQCSRKIERSTLSRFR